MSIRFETSLPPENLICWSDIQLEPSSTSYSECLIGKGSFGAVFRGEYKPRIGSKVPRHVAIKVVTKSMLLEANKYNNFASMLLREINVIREANKNINDLDCIVKVYGGVQGRLSQTLASAFQLNTADECVGIVLRYEPGGSLANLLYPLDGTMEKPLDIVEKFRLLLGISRGLVELHSHSIIHGDIKPSNILLSGQLRPEIRLSDFGLSTIREKFDDGQGISSVNQTTHGKGTPVYNAPEKIVNPFSPGNVSDCTRMTDIYALAILCWEVLTRSKPFADVKDLVTLAVKIHQGDRPPTKELPPDTSDEVVEMINKCWSSDRLKRLPANKCLEVILNRYQKLSSDHYDIFLSYKSENGSLVQQIYKLLTRSGYRVWYDQNDLKREIETSMVDGITKSTVFVACVNGLYQDSTYCMFELRNANEMKKTIIPLVLQPINLGNNWANTELQSICQFDKNLYCDISSAATLPHAWVKGVEPIESDLISLRESLESKLPKLLSDIFFDDSSAYIGNITKSTSFRVSNQIYSSDTMPLISENMDHAGHSKTAGLTASATATMEKRKNARSSAATYPKNMDHAWHAKAVGLTAIAKATTQGHMTTGNSATTYPTLSTTTLSRHMMEKHITYSTPDSIVYTTSSTAAPAFVSATPTDTAITVGSCTTKLKESSLPIKGLKMPVASPNAAATQSVRKLVSASDNKTVKIWNIDVRPSSAQTNKVPSIVNTLAVMANERIVSGADDSILRVWGGRGFFRKEFKGHVGPILIVVTLSERHFVSGSADNTLKIWDVNSSQCLRTFDQHEGYVHSVTSVFGGQLVSGSADKTLKIWDVQSNRCLDTLRGHTEPIYAVASVGDKWFVSGSADKTLKLWDVRSNQCQHTLEGHNKDVYAVASVGNGRFVSASRDTTLKLWDVRSNRCQHTLEGHNKDVYAVASVGDGRFVSASRDTTLKIWDTQSIESLLTLEDHRSPVRCVAYL